AEHEADLRRRPRQQVPLPAAGPRDEVEHAGQRRDAEADVGQRGHRRVDDEQARVVALLGGRAHHPQAVDGRGRAEGNGTERQHARHPAGHGHASSMSAPYPTTPNATYTAANAPRISSHSVPSPGWPASAACQASVAASSTGAATGSSNRGNKVSRTFTPADSVAYRVPAAASPTVASRQAATTRATDAMRAS